MADMDHPGREGRSARRRRSLASVAALGGALALTSALGGCIDDTDCGICDEDHLVLQTISGPNYRGELVHVISPECEGPRCPRPFDRARYFVDTIERCQDTDEAIADGRSPDYYCKLSPLVVATGLQFVFNNLLEATTIELARKRPEDPRFGDDSEQGLIEIYDWKTRIVHLEGPIARYTGDIHERDGTQEITAFRSLSCLDNLAAGVTAVAGEGDDPCDRLSTIADGDGRLIPMRTHIAQGDAVDRMIANPGGWDDRALGEAVKYDCQTPEDGADTCCSQCDFALSVQVAKYGGKDGERFSPGAGAIACDPDGDALVDCRDFAVWVDRGDERLSYRYAWDGPERESFALPRADKLRETHPDRRPAGLEQLDVGCTTDDDCRDPGGNDLIGYTCVGTDDQGRSCTPGAGDPSCGGGHCRAPWFVTCSRELDGIASGYCVDTRFDSDAAGACWYACDDGSDCANTGTGHRIATCDADANGRLTAAECCPDGEPCDPIFSDPQHRAPELHYDRAAGLPEAVRVCDCSDVDNEACKPFIAETCNAQTEGSGDYAVKFVTRLGGVIYDPALKGVKFLPADEGAEARAAVESCAEARGRIAPRSLADGWRAHDALGLAAESYEDYDRGLCSDTTYTAVFAEPADDDPHDQIVRDKADNTLSGKTHYRFTTVPFSVVPGSGFPGDALRIGPCDTFSLAFTNKYDLSPANLAKLRIVRVDDGEPAAGGPGCAETRAEREAGAPPCLSFDVSDQFRGVLHFRVDAGRFGPVLETDVTYVVDVPGVARADWNRVEGEAAIAAAQTAYAAAFWDVCGMPIVLGDEAGAFTEPRYTFTIDPERCGDDADGDGVPFSCDNAPDVANPDQSDLDGDGIGDVADSCPTLVGGSSGDSDRDGVGNACDACVSAPSQYNQTANASGVPFGLFVRGIPSQVDSDRDGIGDVCDNCPTVANCSGYGPDRPYRLGNALDPGASDCQTDVDDVGMVGDACVGMQADGAAGPIGLGAGDDFDQDGLVNTLDACPRQPLEDRIACADASACPAGRACTGASEGSPGVCDHLDTDGDGVGDICDTCPYQPNGKQVTDGGAQEDDPDGDFVGAVCELGDGCSERAGPRPIGFYAVASAAQCCTTALVADGDDLVVRGTGVRLLDPEGLPVRVTCADDGVGCRRLPAEVAARPGVLAPPPGCDAALADAGLSLDDNTPLDARFTDGDLDALWRLQCTLPVLDQDFDDLADVCDLCPFAFDPDNAPYIDANNKLWPSDGAVCSGPAAMAECSGVTPGGDDGGSSDAGGTGDSGG